MAVDWDKPIRTKCGRKARLLGTLAGVADHEYRRVVAVTYPHSNRETIYVHRDNGELVGEDDCIVNVTQRHVRWLNVYPVQDLPIAGSWPTREEADRKAGNDRIACIRIEFEEGEGL